MTGTRILACLAALAALGFYLGPYRALEADEAEKLDCRESGGGHAKVVGGKSHIARMRVRSAAGIEVKGFDLLSSVVGIMSDDTHIEQIG